MEVLPLVMKCKLINFMFLMLIAFCLNFQNYVFAQVPPPYNCEDECEKNNEECKASCTNPITRFVCVNLCDYTLSKCYDDCASN